MAINPNFAFLYSHTSENHPIIPQDFRKNISIGHWTETDMKFLTGDKEFRNLENVEFVK